VLKETWLNIDRLALDYWTVNPTTSSPNITNLPVDSTAKSILEDFLDQQDEAGGLLFPDIRAKYLGEAVVEEEDEEEEDTPPPFKERTREEKRAHNREQRKSRVEKSRNLPVTIDCLQSILTHRNQSDLRYVCFIVTLL
jgi:hypothetical protein